MRFPMLVLLFHTAGCALDPDPTSVAVETPDIGPPIIDAALTDAGATSSGGSKHVDAHVPDAAFSLDAALPDAAISLDARLADAAISMDAALTDAALTDAALTDAALTDAASAVDATHPSATPDQATPDLARPDMALADAAPLDAAPLDAGPLDAAPLDAAPLDAAPPDAAPIDRPPLFLQAQEPGPRPRPPETPLARLAPPDCDAPDFPDLQPDAPTPIERPAVCPVIEQPPPPPRPARCTPITDELIADLRPPTPEHCSHAGRPVIRSCYDMARLIDPAPRFTTCSRPWSDDTRWPSAPICEPMDGGWQAVASVDDSPISHLSVVTNDNQMDWYTSGAEVHHRLERFVLDGDRPVKILHSEGISDDGFPHILEYARAWYDVDNREGPTLWLMLHDTEELELHRGGLGEIIAGGRFTFHENGQTARARLGDDCSERIERCNPAGLRVGFTENDYEGSLYSFTNQSHDACGRIVQQNRNGLIRGWTYGAQGHVSGVATFDWEDTAMPTRIWIIESDARNEVLFVDEYPCTIETCAPGRCDESGIICFVPQCDGDVCPLPRVDQPIRPPPGVEPIVRHCVGRHCATVCDDAP